MLNWVIDFSLRHRPGPPGSAGPVRARLRYLDIDAFPDTTPVQVQLNTYRPALGPEEVEQQITYPDRTSFPAGLPGPLQYSVRSRNSAFPTGGRFKGRHRHLLRPPARQRAADHRRVAPAWIGHDGPVATGLGEVFHYVVSGKRVTTSPNMRTIHDWVIKPKLRTVNGAAEVNSWGGFEKQYQVRLDPDASSNTA